MRQPLEAYAERLAVEIKIIREMGFSGYFLITWDFIRYAHEHGIPVGPGRGSAAGSLVAYALTITDLDPLRYSLLFERFLNPERVSMPDFDIDFCMDRREEVIRYVQEKYGSDKVGQIITFGALLSKAAVRDIGPGGHYLGHPHTQENFQQAFFMPDMFDNNSIEQWAAEGSVEITERALKRARDLLSAYQEPKLDEGVDEALRDYIARREREIPAMEALNDEY